MDAVLYTSVSHNLSMGFGTFWFPQFSVHNVAGLSSFHEQPPLVFGIQSLFFRLMGDSMYVERFYTFLTMCINAFLIVYLWREIFRNDEVRRKLGWLPVMLWITIPVCFWSFSNNMHENTMSIFTICSVVFACKALNSEKPAWIFAVLSGIFIVLASLSKGLPGFFPLSVPFLFWLTTGRVSFRKTLVHSLVITGAVALIYLVLFLLPASSESLSIYFFKRAVHRINEAPTVNSRFYILGRIFMELLPQLILVIILFSIAKVRKMELKISENIRDVLFFTAVGLAASAPIMLTLVQKGFYIVPSLPFFAIGMAILVSSVTGGLVEHITPHSRKQKIFMSVCVSLLVGTLIVSFLQKGKTSRKHGLLHDVYLIGKVVPAKSTVSIPEKMWDDWDLQCYLVRYFNISLEKGFNNEYGILERNLDTGAPVDYDKLNIPTIQYDLYRRVLPDGSQDRSR